MIFWEDWPQAWLNPRWFGCWRRPASMMCLENLEWSLEHSWNELVLEVEIALGCWWNHWISPEWIYNMFFFIYIHIDIYIYIYYNCPKSTNLDTWIGETQHIYVSILQEPMGYPCYWSGCNQFISWMMPFAHLVVALHTAPFIFPKLWNDASAEVYPLVIEHRYRKIIFHSYVSHYQRVIP